MKLEPNAFICFCLLAPNLFAQTPSAIEADLLKSYKQIDYWYGKQDADSTGTALGKLYDANDLFAKKLQGYIAKYPATIGWPFNSLVKSQVDISTSDDGLFRIYSWDSLTGGTMHYFESVFQYKTASGVAAVIDTPKGDGDNRPNYDKLYTFKTGNKTYYLAIIFMIGSTKACEGGVQVFSIGDGKLNDDTKVIKTHSGLHSQITYGYDRSVTSEKTNAEVYFNTKTQSIYIPVVSVAGKLTNNYIIYKFTGQYFERVKN
jgi:hypothetical protein